MTDLDRVRAACQAHLKIEADILAMPAEQIYWFMSKPGHRATFAFARLLLALLPEKQSHLAGSAAFPKGAWCLGAVARCSGELKRVDQEPTLTERGMALIAKMSPVDIQRFNSLTPGDIKELLASEPTGTDDDLIPRETVNAIRTHLEETA